MTENITSLLDSAYSGDEAATDELFRVVYGELRKIARSHRRRWVGNDTLNTTALIHEAFVKLSGSEGFKNREHFYATASRAMRQILVTYAERQRTLKRGGNAKPIPLDEVLLPSNEAAEEMLAVHEALLSLEQKDRRCVRVVECRFFGGLTVEETAAALDTSPATVKRDWGFARAWLVRELGDTSATALP